MGRGRGRPGGNPELKKHEFQQKHNWSESCSKGIYLRLPPLMKEAMDELDISQEDIRQMIGDRIKSKDKKLFQKIVKE